MLLGSGQGRKAILRSDTFIFMFDKGLIDKIREVKDEKRLTLHELSVLTGMQIGTLERWFKTNRINKLYAQLVKQRLGIE